MMDGQHLSRSGTLPGIYEAFDTNFPGACPVLIHSSIYRQILRDGFAQGRFEAARSLLILLTTKRFGPPEPRTLAAIENVFQVEDLEMLMERLLDHDLRDWDDFMRIVG